MNWEGNREVTGMTGGYDMNRAETGSRRDDLNVQGLILDMSVEQKERMGEKDERCLVLLMRSRDPVGLKILMKKYHDKLFSVANRICNNHSDSEEVLQDVYMIAMNKIDKFQERSTLSTWLYRITVNAALMKLRTQRFSRNTVSVDGLASTQNWEEASLGFAEEARSPDEVVLSRELFEQIRDSVADLPSIYRDVFFLRDIKGFTIKETSDILNTTPAAIKSRLHRSRFFLQSRLRSYLSEN